MGFNFKAAVEESVSDTKADKLGLIVLGASGSGKSRLMGTLPGKVLYVYTDSERHGVVSAIEGGADLVPVCIDRDNGVVLSADATYKRLLDCLSDLEGIKAEGITSIVVDGFTEIENIILETSSWKQAVLTQYKGVASYAGPVTLSLFRPIVKLLQKAQSDLGVNYIVTCILDVKETAEDGAIAEAYPKLKGFDVAVGLIQQFPDILVIGQMSKDGGFPIPRIQFVGGVTKTTKDFVTKVVRKLHNFTPRLTGADMSTFPSSIPADLGRICEAKVAKKYVKKG